jgi:hypothetical protein
MWRNNGGAMVEATIRMVDANVPVTTVWASRGKAARAEPVSALYEQGRVHHIGTFSELEDQMCAFTSDFDRARAGYSPDRLDALVWGLTDLMIQPMQAWGWYELARQRAMKTAERNEPPPEDPDHIPWAPGCVEYEKAMRERAKSASARPKRPGSRSSRPRPPQHKHDRVHDLERGSSLKPGSIATSRRGPGSQATL